VSTTPNIEQLRKTITAEVFAATGKKVDPDDPIVTAALVQAAFMVTASSLAAGKIQQVADQVAERASRFEAAIKANGARVDYGRLADRLAGIAGDLTALPGRRDLILCAIAGSVIGGAIVVGAMVVLGVLH
jgi:hypothetical protein